MHARCEYYGVSWVVQGWEVLVDVAFSAQFFCNPKTAHVIKSDCGGNKKYHSDPSGSTYDLARIKDQWKDGSIRVGWELAGVSQQCTRWGGPLGAALGQQNVAWKKSQPVHLRGRVTAAHLSLRPAHLSMLNLPAPRVVGDIPTPSKATLGPTLRGTALHAWTPVALPIEKQSRRPLTEVTNPYAPVADLSNLEQTGEAAQRMGEICQRSQVLDHYNDTALLTFRAMCRHQLINEPCSYLF